MKILMIMAGAMAAFSTVMLHVTIHWVQRLPLVLRAVIFMVLSGGMIIFLVWADSGQMDPFADPKMRQQIWTSAGAAVVSVPLWMYFIHVWTQRKIRRTSEFGNTRRRILSTMPDEQLKNITSDEEEKPN